MRFLTHAFIRSSDSSGTCAPDGHVEGDGDGLQVAFHGIQQRHHVRVDFRAHCMHANPSQIRSELGNEPKLAMGKRCASRDTDHITAAAAFEAFQERKNCMMSVQQGFCSLLLRMS